MMTPTSVQTRTSSSILDTCTWISPGKHLKPYSVRIWPIIFHYQNGPYNPALLTNSTTGRPSTVQDGTCHTFHPRLPFTLVVTTCPHLSEKASFPSAHLLPGLLSRSPWPQSHSPPFKTSFEALARGSHPQAEGRRAKPHLRLPSARSTPEPPLLPHPHPWENCLPQGRTLVPKRLGTAALEHKPDRIRLPSAPSLRRSRLAAEGTRVPVPADSLWPFATPLRSSEHGVTCTASHTCARFLPPRIALCWECLAKPHSLFGIHLKSSTRLFCSLLPLLEPRHSASISM